MQLLFFKQGLDAKKFLELKLWTLQALLYEYTLQYFEITLLKICDSRFYIEDTAQISYDYDWLDFSDRPLDKCTNIIVPQECLLLINNLFSEKIHDLDILLYNSARILLTAHQMESGIECLMIPGITDVINSTAISSIEPLAYFINQQVGQCDKCGNKVFSIVAKIKELLTKYFDQSFASYYCKTYYSDRSKLFHQGYTKTNHIKYGSCYPLINPHDPSKILMQASTVDPTLFIAINEQYDTADPDDAHSGIMIPLRNMINEAYALDIGRKIKAQQRQAMKDGKFVGGRAPYGYLKAPDDCHQLIIDPDAAPVVRQIFQWASQGEGLNTIVLRLNTLLSKSPLSYCLCRISQAKAVHTIGLASEIWQRMCQCQWIFPIVFRIADLWHIPCA